MIRPQYTVLQALRYVRHAVVRASQRAPVGPAPCAIALAIAVAAAVLFAQRDLVAAPDDTGLLSPSAQAADTGGDGDGFELTPENAFADDALTAATIDGAGDRHRYAGYGINLLPGSTVEGIEVRLDWFLDSTDGVSSMDVELSWDGGTTWTAAQTDAVESTAEHTGTVGGPTDTWDRTWTTAELADANFRVRLTANSDAGDRDFFLDWVPVRVLFTPPPTATPTPVDRHADAHGHTDCHRHAHRHSDADRDADAD